MQKALFIAWKDFLIRLNDRAGFAFLIITPLVITLIMGAVFGGDDDNVNFRVAVAVVNHDTGSEVGLISEQIQERLQNASGADNAPDISLPNLSDEALDFGSILTEILTSNGIDEILDVTTTDDEATARAAVEAGDTFCCVVIIPENFSRAILLKEAANVVIYSEGFTQHKIVPLKR